MKKRIKLSPILAIVMFVLGSLPITLADSKDEAIGLAKDGYNLAKEYREEVYGSNKIGRSWDYLKSLIVNKEKAKILKETGSDLSSAKDYI